MYWCFYCGTKTSDNNRACSRCGGQRFVDRVVTYNNNYTPATQGNGCLNILAGIFVAAVCLYFLVPIMGTIEGNWNAIREVGLVVWLKDGIPIFVFLLLAAFFTYKFSHNWSWWDKWDE